MMMGTADEIVKAPEKAIVFAEDLPEEAQATNLVILFTADYKCAHVCYEPRVFPLWNRMKNTLKRIIGEPLTPTHTHTFS